MVVSTVASSTFIRDFVLYFRDRLTTLLTDPLSSRQGDNKFIMTSYPTRQTQFPIITIVDAGQTNMRRLGMQSSNILLRLAVEIRVWGRSEPEKDLIAQEIINDLRSDQFTASVGAINAGLHDFKIDSVVNVSEGGESGIKSKIIRISYLYLMTS